MPEKYTDRIKDHCESSGIEIPTGFYRHPASRYAVIDLGVVPAKLVARTWSKQEDVVYYLQHLAAETLVRVLDFKDRQELSLENNKALKRGAPF